jgi:DNA polymerase I-like protein with 3'-5' exonuclease and polymerase domains
VWEISSGEHELDENIKFLEDFGTPLGNLRATLTSYNNDLYWTMPFSKEERSTIAFVNPSDKDFLDYAVLDVQCLIGIQEQQLARAKLLKLGSKSYLPFYRNLVVKQMSNTVHTISHMEQRGVYIDGYYLAHLKSKESPLVQSIADTKRELFSLPVAKEANQRLLEKNSSVSYAKGGLFNSSSWVLNLNKPEHKIVMFLDVMGLEPLTKTKTGQPQIDKNFQKVYADKHREVKLFTVYQETTKLWGTYVKGWYQKIKDSPDGSFDGRLRPSYGFFRVVTGRLNSQDPSLQQVPSRGKLSKYVKRAFVAPPGTLYVKYDYSAHEVRFWGIIAKDDVIAATFKVGQKLRKAFRKNPTPELAAKLRKQGDVHIINIYHFFKKWVDKSHPLRDAIKAVVFGTIYQMSAGSLAKSLRKQRVGELDDKVRSIKKRIAEIKKELGVA